MSLWVSTIHSHCKILLIPSKVLMEEREKQTVTKQETRVFNCLFKTLLIALLIKSLQTDTKLDLLLLNSK